MHDVPRISTKEATCKNLGAPKVVPESETYLKDEVGQSQFI